MAPFLVFPAGPSQASTLHRNHPAQYLAPSVDILMTEGGRRRGFHDLENVNWTVLCQTHLGHC